ncbi:hypothetical protein 1 [Hubei diptera virus 14]|uniref:hypothetical protein 1 n=1 Tax=Hubei diptera virus 14 TaxID=1922875 RepID=UPI00090B1FB0|nr:hypothetical protein 1 [Hubei diptera virus 14]APG75803.1 hypothetical protein 1 [Hubei diptera virus 14]
MLPIINILRNPQVIKQVGLIVAGVAGGVAATAGKLVGGNMKSSSVGLLPKVDGLTAGVVLASTCVLTGGVCYLVKRNKRDMVGTVYQLKEKPFREKTKQGLDRVIAESVKSGSEEMSKPRPKCQILIGRKNGEEFEIYGNAVRIWDSLVTPTHVVHDASLEDGSVYIKGSQAVIKLDVTMFDALDTDLSYANLTQTQFSTIGAPTVSLDENLTCGALVEVTGVVGKGTVGKLYHDSSIFGRVIYNGSTKGGYSGAPYMRGNRVVGVHCWGGKENAGYSASYIKVLLCIANKQKPEDTEDFLLKIVGDLDENAIRNTGSEVLIRHKGQYHSIDYDEWAKVSDMYDKKIRQLDNKYSYTDAESMEMESLRHSGEYKSLMQPGASGSVNQADQAPLDLCTLSMKQLKKLLIGSHNSKQGSPKLNSPSAGPLSAVGTN